MTTHVLDAATSELSLWTYKAGLLSRVAHDLCFHAEGVEATVTRSEHVISVQLSFPVAGLRVQGQVKNGQVKPLSSKDHAEIEGNLLKVLDGARFPKIVYSGAGEATADGATLEGTLTIAGRERPLPLRARLEQADGESRVQGEIRFLQSTFGIKPFSALMGALKVKDEVRVSWDLRFREAIVEP